LSIFISILFALQIFFILTRYEKKLKKVVDFVKYFIKKKKIANYKKILKKDFNYNFDFLSLDKLYRIIISFISFILINLGISYSYTFMVSIIFSTLLFNIINFIFVNYKVVSLNSFFKLFYFEEMEKEDFLEKIDKLEKILEEIKFF